ncbi:MAG TPA: site-specific DNA-methyltransferase [Pseudonocardiaceae bacterium]
MDLICTSPPYWALRSYTDGGAHYDGQIGSEPTPAAYVDSLIECTRECMRVLKPAGSLWVNLGDKYSTGAGGGGNLAEMSAERYAGGGHTSAKARTATKRVPGMPPKSLIGLPWRYALRCIDDLGLILRAEVIWSKPNGLPESVTDRVRRSHEQWFHLTLNPRYYGAVDEIREPYSENKPWGTRTLGRTDASRGDTGQADKVIDWRRSENPLGKLPGSVWTIAAEPLTVPDHLGVDHFAAFATEWPRRIILGWSPPGGTVADPFGGTGTTALVAEALGRRGISVDMSADYCRLAKWRTSDRAQIAKALGVAKPPKETDGQFDLFGEVVA